MSRLTVTLSVDSSGRNADATVDFLREALAGFDGDVQICAVAGPGGYVVGQHVKLVCADLTVVSGEVVESHDDELWVDPGPDLPETYVHPAEVLCDLTVLEQLRGART